MIIFAVIDALLGSKINSIISSDIVTVSIYGAIFVVGISAIQWIHNLIQVSKANVNNKVKSQWRYYMVLLFIFANAEFYEAFIAEGKDGRFKKIRDFLRMKSLSAFRP